MDVYVFVLIACFTLLLLFYSFYMYYGILRIFSRYCCKKLIFGSVCVFFFNYYHVSACSTDADETVWLFYIFLYFVRWINRSFFSFFLLLRKLSFVPRKFARRLSILASLTIDGLEASFQAFKKACSDENRKENNVYASLLPEPFSNAHMSSKKCVLDYKKTTDWHHRTFYLEGKNYKAP